MAAPPVSPVLREKYDRRQQEVIDACARVFAQRGFHATSIDDLIAETSLTRGGLYHYIGSKQELLFRVFDELMTPLLERARPLAAPPGDPEERLRKLTRVWMRHVEGHRDHVLVFNQERHTVARDPQWEQVRTARAEFEGILASVLAEGQRAGSFVMADPQLTALAFLGMVNHTPQWYDPGRRLSADEIAEGFCDMLLGGIRA